MTNKTITTYETGNTKTKITVQLGAVKYVLSPTLAKELSEALDMQLYFLNKETQ